MEMLNKGRYAGTDQAEDAGPDILGSVSFLSGMKHYSRYLSDILTDTTAMLPPLVISILFTNFLFSRMIKSSFLFSVCIYSR